MIGVVPLLPPPPLPPGRAFKRWTGENFSLLFKFTYSVNYWLLFTRISDPIPITTSGKSGHMHCFGKLCAFSDLTLR